MISVDRIKEMKVFIENARREGKRIGFVPTMGYLHQGHCSLIQQARGENDLVVVSIFVNPVQFGPKEDYQNYPRDLERDKELAEKAGTDILFNPSVEEMYPKDFKTYVNVKELTDKMCGAVRPGHFQGVTTVVNKLFNIVNPDKAYFGQKDAQQVAVIQQMVRDLNMEVKIISCPIVRDKDGLALSSRNGYLDAEERNAAFILNKALLKAKKLINEGERHPSRIKDYIIENIRQEPRANVDYVAVVEAESLKSVDYLEGNILFAIAVWIGKTRLIDNMIMKI